MAKKPLTPLEKATLKYVKNIKKTGKPGDVQATVDRMSPATKATLSSAIKKSASPTRASKVNKPTKQAKPDVIKVRSRTTGKLSTFNAKPTPRGGGGMRGGMLGGGGLRGNVNK